MSRRKVDPGSLGYCRDAGAEPVLRILPECPTTSPKRVLISDICNINLLSVFVFTGFGSHRVSIAAISGQTATG